MLKAIKSWWTRQLVPALPTLRVFLGFLSGAFLIIAILVGFKYLFFTNCVSVGNVKECVAANIDSSNTLFAIGGILVAIVALIPTLWNERKIKDAQKEISQQIAEEVKGSMQRLSAAQMLIFDADKYNNPVALPIQEANIQQAISLWPAFKKEEYRKLGNAYSKAVVDAFYQGLSVISANTLMAQGLAVHKNQLSRYIERAIFYLEETVLHSDAADRDGLVSLACMYGCAGKYEEMIRVIERALRVDENVLDDFQESKRLSLLVRACRVDKRKIERLGKKIAKELPLSKEDFIRVLQDESRQSLSGVYDDFFAIVRQPNSKGSVYMIRITSYSNSDDGMKVGGQTFREFSESEDVQDIPPHGSLPLADWLLPVEEFFNEINNQFFIICYKEA